jgi:hypothetical protein
MAHRLNKPNQLALICYHFEVACGERPAEEGYGRAILMEHGTEARSGGVAVHDECGGEVRKVQDWGGDEGRLEVGEGGLNDIRPLERVLAKQLRQRCGDDPVVLDEPPVIPGQPEEAA